MGAHGELAGEEGEGREGQGARLGGGAGCLVRKRHGGGCSEKLAAPACSLCVLNVSAVRCEKKKGGRRKEKGERRKERKNEKEKEGKEKKKRKKYGKNFKLENFRKIKDNL
jgi:hypothetical protein